MFETRKHRVILKSDLINFTNQVVNNKLNSSIIIDEIEDLIEKAKDKYKAKKFQDFENSGDSYILIFEDGDEIKRGFECAKEIIKRVIDKNNTLKDENQIFIRSSLHYARFNFESKNEPLSFSTILESKAYKNIITISSEFRDELIEEIKDIKLKDNKDELKGFGEIEFYSYEVKQNFIEDIKRKVEDSTKKFESIKLKLNIHSKLPERDRKFTGRIKELESFTQKLIDRETLAIVSQANGIVGMGGVGKTAITIEICRIFREGLSSEQKKSPILNSIFKNNKKFFIDGILWIKFEKELNYDETLEIVINQLGINFENITNIEEKLKEILFEKDILIVLDSAEQNIKNFRKFYELFHNFPRIITSRIELNFENIKINTLTKDEAYELFIKILDRNIEKEIENIYKLCEDIGYLPLAIRILARRAKSKNYPISKIIKEFEYSKLKLLNDNLNNGITLENRDAYATFELSYKDLLPSQRNLFMIASTFKYPFDEDDLKGVAKNENIQSDLEKLIDYSMLSSEIDKQEVTKYSIHPLLREFGLLKLNFSEFREKISESRRSYFLEVVKTKKSSDVVDEVIIVMQETLKTKEEIYLEFAQNVDLILFEIGRWKQKVEINKKAINIAKKLQNREMEILFSALLAEVLMKLDKKDEARKHFLKCLNYYEENKNYKMVLSIHNTLLIFSNQKSKEIFRNSLKFIYKSLLYSEYDIYSHFCRTIGWINQEFNYFDLAKKYFYTTIQNINYKNDLIRVLIDFLNININTGEYKSNITFIKKLYKLPTISLVVKVYILENLIKNYIYLRDIKNAKIAFSHWKNKIKDLNIIETIYTKYEFLGKIAFLEKNHDKAIRYFKELEDENYQIYLIGKCYLEKKEIDKAIECLNQSLKEVEDPIAKVEVNIDLAKAYLLNDEKKKAVELITICENTLIKYKIKNFKKLYEIKREIIELVGYEEFSKIEIENKHKIFTTNKDKFLQFDNLEKTITTKDNKEMVLIPDGMFFYGDGERVEFNMENMFNNIDEIFKGKYFKDKAKYFYLYPFYIDKAPVTNSEYFNFCKETNYKSPEHWENEKFKDGEENYPIINITFKDAKAYAKWTNKSLPISEEWEKACRGENGYNYFFGDEWQEELIYQNKEFLKYKNLTVFEPISYEEYYKWMFGKDNYKKFIEVINLVKEKDFKISDNFELTHSKQQRESSNEIQFSKDDIRLLIPNHQFNISEEYFLRLIANSFHFEIEAKENILNTFSELSQKEVDELVKNFELEANSRLSLNEHNIDEILDKYRKTQKEWHKFLLKKFGAKLESELKENKELFNKFKTLTIFPFKDLEKYKKLFHEWLTHKDIIYYSKLSFLELNKLELETKIEYLRDMVIFQSFSDIECNDSLLTSAIDIKVDKIYFLKAIANSISLSNNEKEKILDNFNELSQYQINELIKIFAEEQKKFSLLGTTDWDELCSLILKHQQEWLQLLTKRLNIEFIREVNKNLQNSYSVSDMGGNIYEMTLKYDSLILMGGNRYIVLNPKEELKTSYKSSISIKKEIKEVEIEIGEKVVTKDKEFLKYYDLTIKDIDSIKNYKNILNSKSSDSEIDIDYNLIPHSFDFNRIYFLKLLANSLKIDSYTKDKILNKFLSFSKNKLDDVIKVMEEEIKEFFKLDEKSQKQALELLKQKQFEWQKILIKRLEVKEYKIEKIIKKEKREEENNKDYKRLDLGFRCVKHIF